MNSMEKSQVTAVIRFGHFNTLVLYYTNHDGVIHACVL